MIPVINIVNFTNNSQSSLTRVNASLLVKLNDKMPMLESKLRSFDAQNIVEISTDKVYLHKVLYVVAIAEQKEVTGFNFHFAIYNQTKSYTEKLITFIRQ